MLKFEIGDTVRIVRSNTADFDRRDLGMIGIVDAVSPANQHEYLIDFGEEYPFTHRGNIVRRDNPHYRWYMYNYLELVEDELPAVDGAEFDLLIALPK